MVVYYLSLPAIIFVSFYKIDWFNPANLKVLGFNLFLLLVISVAILFILSLTKLKPTYKAAIFACTLVGNTVYMGFPLAKKAFETNLFDNFLAAATPQLVFGIILSILVFDFYVLKSKKISLYLRDFVFNPLSLSLFAGIILSVFTFVSGLIKILLPPIEMLGATASPLALVTLGGFLHGKFLKSDLQSSVFVAIIKFALYPMLILFFGKFFLSQPVSPSILAASMPTAVTVFVVSEKFNVLPKFVASTILVTTLLSILTISLTLVLIN
jgi:hypothetical protein